MNRILFLFVLFFTPWYSIAQVTFLVTDKNTHQGVEGTLVTASNATGRVLVHQITDSKGYAQVLVPSYPVNVTLSHLAYESTSFPVSEPGMYEVALIQEVTQLDDIVVTGQFEPQSAKRSVYRVRVLDTEKIKATGATRLQDVFNTELNIRFSQDLALGGSNLSMQGLQGQNVKVLIDGVPMVGRQGTSNEININQINIK